MRLDYEIVWAENNEIYNRQFSYEISGESIPLSSYLPSDLYEFYEELTLIRKLPVMVFAGLFENHTGLIKYCRSNPIYE